MITAVFEAITESEYNYRMLFKFAKQEVRKIENIIRKLEGSG
jgi:hypothetical protein